MKNPSKYNVTNTVSLFVAYMASVVTRREVKAEDVAQRITAVRLGIIDRYRRTVQAIRAAIINARSAIATALYNASVRVAPKASPVPALATATVYTTPAPAGWDVVDTSVPANDVPALVLTFNDSTPSVLQDATESEATVSPPKPVETLLSVPESEETPLPMFAPADAVPHVKTTRTKGKKRADYKPAKDVQAGGLYWYKQGRRWVEMIAPEVYAEAA